MDQNVAKPFISIIMPAYNAEEFISESIQSVLEQTYVNWELVIVDDGSEDRTGHIVKEFQEQDRRIVYIHQKNKRLGAARNTGIKAAKGSWIAFLDSDDLWFKNKLEKQTEVLSNEDIDVIYTSGYYLNNETGELTPYKILEGKYAGRDLYKLIFEHNRIPVLSVLVKKSVIDLIGKQDESPRAHGCEDLDYWLRLCRQDSIFVGLEDHLFKYRVHTQGMSTDNLKMQMASCYVLFKNLDYDFLEKPTHAKEKLSSDLRLIINQLYSKHDHKSIPYFLQLLSTISKNPFRYKIVIALIKILGAKSRRFTNILLHQS